MYKKYLKLNSLQKSTTVELTEAVEYTDCVSAVWLDSPPPPQRVS